MADPTEAKRIIEAALLCSGEPVSLGDLKRLFDGELGADTLKRLLVELRDDWEGRAVELIELASGWRFQTRPEMQPFVERLHPEKPPRYSRAVMETLAIIAYRQPVSRPEVDAVRGVNSDAVLDNLLERRLIRIAGRKDSPGRPFLYETTREFLVAFGLRDIADLPRPDGELIIPETPPPDPSGQGELATELAGAVDPSQQDPGPGGAELASRG
jgi:segregation and condensation protein B